LDCGILVKYNQNPKLEALEDELLIKQNKMEIEVL